MLVGEHTSHADPDDKVLSAGRAIYGRAAAEKNSFTPPRMAKHINWAVGGNLGQKRRAAEAEEQCETNGFLHIFRLKRKR
jgi:hypothetical protein